MPCRIVPTEPPRAGDSSRPLPSPADLPSSLPRLCLLLSEKGDRVAVDEECVPSSTHLPSSHPCLLLSEKGDRSAVDEECVPFPTDLPSAIPTSAHPCLLLLEKGDRVAVDEECVPSPTDLPSAIQTSAPRPAFSCRRRGTAKRWMRSAYPLPPTSRQQSQPPLSFAFSCG